MSENPSDPIHDPGRTDADRTPRSGLTPTDVQILRPLDFYQRSVLVGGLRMNVISEGPEDGPLVILLHGFPEFWYSWRYQIRPLAEAGFRVVAPDQRGFNLTEKAEPYDVFTLCKDVVNLIRSKGRAQAHLVGHDLGGLVAWLTAAFYPEVVEKLVVLNCPHPVAGLSAVRSLYVPQILKSWYIFLFQLPALPELLLSIGDYAPLTDVITRSGKGRMTAEEVRYYRDAWAQPGALSAALGWYRAFFNGRGALLRRDTLVRLPTRLIWGEPDVALDKQLAEWSHQYCPDLDIHYVPDAGHFVHQEAPAIVNKLILDFLQIGR